MLDERQRLNQRLLQADLMTGAVALSELNHHGIPEGRLESFPEQPFTLLVRVLGTVEPGDLSKAAGELWLNARLVWPQRLRLTWDLIESRASREARREAAWMREHGLSLPLYAPWAARRLLELSSATEAYRDAREAAAAAVETAREALRGV